MFTLLQKEFPGNRIQEWTCFVTHTDGIESKEYNSEYTTQINNSNSKTS